MLAAGLIASVAISAGGCGGQEQAASAPQAAKAEDVAETEGGKDEDPYAELLLEFRDAAMAGATYDAYGYAEYIPHSQRAAIDGFCLVADKVRTGAELRRLTNPEYFARQVVSTARPERLNASMASVRRAVAKLQAFVEPESLNLTLVKNYARACY